AANFPPPPNRRSRFAIGCGGRRTSGRPANETDNTKLSLRYCREQQMSSFERLPRRDACHLRNGLLDAPRSKPFRPPSSHRALIRRNGWSSEDDKRASASG